MNRESSGTSLTPEAIENYGGNDELLSDYLRQINGVEIDVQILCLEKQSTGHLDENGKQVLAVSDLQCLKSFEAVKDFFEREREMSQRVLQIIVVKKLSASLLKVLGVRFNMDYDLWTCRLHACDREYFAGPLNHKGAKKYCHFHLGYIEYFQATDETPESFSCNRRINYTTKLTTFPPLTKAHNYKSRIYVNRRVTGHLRKDDNLWTFLYLCDSFPGQDDSRLLSKIPSNGVSATSEWPLELFGSYVSSEYLDQVAQDGFGIIAKILRDIKTSWKIMLSEMEQYLESVTETCSDEDLIEIAPQLHRNFIMNIDLFQRQIFFHSRFIIYLLNAPPQQHDLIDPVLFTKDFKQESDAMVVVNSRLEALRKRTEAILNMGLSLNNIKQARLTSDLAKIQLRDSNITLNQNESIRRLTVVNLLFLPPSFAAAVFGMNTPQTTNKAIWYFVIFATALVIITLVVAIAQSRAQVPSKLSKPSQDLNHELKDEPKDV